MQQFAFFVCPLGIGNKILMEREINNGLLSPCIMPFGSYQSHFTLFKFEPIIKEGIMNKTTCHKIYSEICKILCGFAFY